MAPHQDALSALGNIYDGSSDDDDESVDDEPAAAAASAPAASAPAAATAAAPVKEALPDAGDLLSDMPDEVDWSARPGPVEEEAPGHDPVGTTYNNVPLPTTMAREQDAHNDVAHSKAGKGKGKPGKPGKGRRRTSTKGRLVKRVSEREEDDDEESMNGEGTRAHAMFALLLLVEDFFVVIFAGDFFFAPLC